MGMYLSARKEVYNGKDIIVDFVSMDLFNHLDKNMFLTDTSQIQFVSLYAKLAKRLNIKYSTDNSTKLLRSDIFKLYKETERILRTWVPNPNNDDEYLMEVQIKYLHDFLEVCLLNDEIDVYISW